MGPPPDNSQQVYRWSLIAPDGNPLFEAGETARLPLAEDLPALAWRLLTELGFDAPRHALECFTLPAGRWLVLPQPVPDIAAVVAAPGGDPASDNRARLRTALLLGLCTDAIYDRSGPVIWTQNRLSRFVRLYRPQGFYAD